MPEGRFSVEEFRNRLKLYRIRSRRVEYFSHLGRMEESAWSSKCRTFKVGARFFLRRPRRMWSDVIRSE